MRDPSIYFKPASTISRGGGQCYRVKKKLGEGGYGVVHRVTDLYLGHSLAFEVFKKKQSTYGANEEVMESWEHSKRIIMREIDFLKKHDNVSAHQPPKR
jgi:serine/threonine protein kinase